MSADFITIKVKCTEELSDLLIAELFDCGFDSFQEFDDGFEGSCAKKDFEEVTVNEKLANYKEVSYTIQEADKVNWNEEWEKNYDPVIVDGKCLVRASFHQPDSSYPYEIIVTPKMSFGTGHHPTTSLVLAYQMKLQHEAKRVLDVGCGTGILSIMASMRKAKEIVATDIDDWCIENSDENFSLNKVKNVELLKGQIEVVTAQDFDIVIANINKNVLLDQIADYAKRLVANGVLLLSGFYVEDISDLLAKAESEGLTFVEQSEMDNWAMLVLSKQAS